MGLADFRVEEDLAVRTVIRRETVDKRRKTLITSTTTSEKKGHGWQRQKYYPGVRVAATTLSSAQQ